MNIKIFQITALYLIFYAILNKFEFRVGHRQPRLAATNRGYTLPDVWFC